MNKFCIGDRVRVTTVDEYDIAHKISVGDVGVISKGWLDEWYQGKDDCVFIDFCNGKTECMYIHQLELDDAEVLADNSTEEIKKIAYKEVLDDLQGLLKGYYNPRDNSENLYINKCKQFGVEPNMEEK